MKPPACLDDLWGSVRPMLATSRGRMIALSTPFGKRGTFYEEWVGNNRWERVRITADQCSRLPPDSSAEERKAMGPIWYARSTSVLSVTRSGQSSATTISMRLLNAVASLRFWGEQMPETQLFSGLDLGQVGDPAAFVVLERSFLRVDPPRKGRPGKRIFAPRAVPGKIPAHDVLCRHRGPDERDLLQAGDGRNHPWGRQTGVGRGIVDMLREAKEITNLCPITITRPATGSVETKPAFTSRRPTLWR